MNDYNDLDTVISNPDLIEDPTDAEETVSAATTFDEAQRDYKNALRGLERADEKLKHAIEEHAKAKAKASDTRAALLAFLEARV